MLFEVQHNAVVATDAVVDAVDAVVDVVDAVNVGWVQWLFSYCSTLNVFKSDISFLMNISKLFVHFQYETKRWEVSSLTLLSICEQKSKLSKISLCQAVWIFANNYRTFK